MISEKIRQTTGILNELDIDLWMVFGRESHTHHDPCADMVIGAGYTWASAFLYTRGGQSMAIVGSLDAAEFEKQGHFQKVTGYVGGIRDTLRQTLAELNPAKIAVNYSVDDVMADGLSHGMFLQLVRILEGTPFADRLVSSERIVSALRGRKSPEELRRIRHAVNETEVLYRQTHAYIQPGMTEKEVAAWLLSQVDQAGYETAWGRGQCPSVFTGVPEAGEAHTGPSDKVIQPGHVLNMDFGLRIDDYCSDIQRTMYVLCPGENEAPPEVERAFRTVVESIEIAAVAARPGVEGRVVDAAARDYIVAQGYPEFPHALGHQVGRSPHDGGALFCPEWERYGQIPFLKVEEGQVYTIEPRIHIPGYGVATVEEIVVITPEGGRFLSDFQRTLWLVG